MSTTTTTNNTDNIIKTSLSTSKSIRTIDYTNNPNLSNIEQKILEQYQIMNNLLIQISQELELLTKTTTTTTTSKEDQGKGVSVELVENLRQLETKLVFIYTFFKGAVYSILNAQDYTAEQEQEQQQDKEEEEDDDKHDKEEEQDKEEEDQENVELLEEF